MRCGVTEVHEFVDEGLGHSSYVIDLGDGTAATIDPPRFPIAHEALIDDAASLLTARGVTARVFDGGPDSWAADTGQRLVVGQ
jgi:hypothetical protein